jgi:GT2 family glycosyltransferase
MTARVSVGIITYQSRPYINRCLAAVRAQTVPATETLVWDNASTDGSVALAREAGATVIASNRNIGFAAAANELIRRTADPFFLLLNPDAYPAPDYIEALLRVADSDPRIGSVSGKLLRPSRDSGPAVIDSAGHVLYRNRWAVNRGRDEPDLGQFDRQEEVFGVCAAAALYRRVMLEDVRVREDYFDSAFFAYLEDVDLDWRARLRGWRSHYVPSAVAIHERGHKGKRGVRNPFVMRHSLKNRYLMMVRNDRLRDVLRDLPAIAAMELVRFGHYLVTHPNALAGYVDLIRLLGRAMDTRKEIQRRRAVPPEAFRPWLQPYPIRERLRDLLTG